VGVPLGAWLGFQAGLGVRGFWMGVGASAMLQALFLSCLVSRWDWQGEARRAQERVAAGGGFAAAGAH
jgi:Na+-driven multidrug efflux pump